MTESQRIPKEMDCYGIAYLGTDEMCQMCRASEGCASHSASSDVLEQCETCYLKGTRACAYHGYPNDTIPRSCKYKVGVDAQFALDNLAGTFIIKNLRQQRKEREP